MNVFPVSARAVSKCEDVTGFVRRAPSLTAVPTRAPRGHAAQRCGATRGEGHDRALHSHCRALQAHGAEQVQSRVGKARQGKAGQK